jgi:hypothetical protein
MQLLVVGAGERFAKRGGVVQLLPQPVHRV